MKRQPIIEFFRPDATKLLVSGILFVLLIISFFIFSTILLSYCGKENPAYLDICLDLHKEYAGDSTSLMILVSYYFIIFSIPALPIISNIGLASFSPFMLWMIVLLSNLVYVYLISCIALFIYKKWKRTKN